jgi:hypothetical protein
MPVTTLLARAASEAEVEQALRRQVALVERSLYGQR